MKEIPRKCKICGRDFIAKRSNHECCSAKCNHINQYKKRHPDMNAWRTEVRKCALCGNDFVPKKKRQKFCSEHCKTTYGNSHRTPVEKKCEFCGRAFVTSYAKTRFCSIRCSLKATVPDKVLTCVDCGRKFDFHGRTRKLRCPECSDRHRLEIVHRVIERKSDPYREKIKTLEDGKKFLYRRTCYEWWPKKCVVCGRADDGKFSIDVHHIDGDVDNMRADNLIPLCRFCHKRVHRLGRKIGLKNSLFSYWKNGEQEIGGVTRKLETENSANSGKAKPVMACQSRARSKGRV